MDPIENSLAKNQWMPAWRKAHGRQIFGQIRQCNTLTLKCHINPHFVNITTNLVKLDLRYFAHIMLYISSTDTWCLHMKYIELQVSFIDFGLH